MNPRRTARALPARAAIILGCAAAAALLGYSQPAFALYAEVKPSVKVGADCVGRVSLLAPKLSSCPIAETKLRIWCPNGQVFEGAIESGGPPAAIARSLCNMSQVP